MKVMTSCGMFIATLSVLDDALNDPWAPAWLMWVMVVVWAISTMQFIMFYEVKES